MTVDGKGVAPGNSPDRAGSHPGPGSAEEPILEAVERAFTVRPPAGEGPAEEARPPREEPRPSSEGGPTEGGEGEPGRGEQARPDTGQQPRRGPGVWPPGPPPLPEGAPTALTSPSRSERRRGLAALAAAGVGPEEARQVAGILASDPDPDIRRAAAEALASAPELSLPLELVRQALADPADRVRAAAVPLAARLGPAAVSLVAPLATDRRWPAAQAAALEALPALLAQYGADEGQLDLILAGVAALDPPPLPAERPGLEAMAAAVGPRRLLDRLGRPGPHRPGAARLLLLQAHPASLAAVAALAEDPDEAVREVARAARRLLEQVQAGPPPPERPGPPLPPAEGAEVELIPALARALRDPADEVRRRSQEALRRLPDPVLVAWVGRALNEPRGELPELAAALVERVGLAPPALPLLRRACSLPPEDRGPYLGALASLRLEPAEIGELVASVEPGLRREAVRLAWQVWGRAVLPHLHPLLEDSSGPVRLAVMEVLDQSGHPSAAEVARRLLREDSSAAVRAAAVHALARAGEEARAEAVSRGLADPDPDVRATALEAVPPGSVPDLVGLVLPALDDPDERVWRAALSHLAAVPDRDLPLLWGALRDTEPRRREELLGAIERLDRDRLARLAELNARAPDPTDRVLAVRLAARAATPRGAAVATAALADPDPTVRRTAASAMSALRAPSAVESLARALSDPQVEVRMEAVRALSVIDDDEVPRVLVSALKDPEVRVRDAVAEALTQWRSPAVARRVAGALSSPDLRRAAGEVLARMGETAVEPLVEVAAGTDPEAAAAAGDVLERLVGAGAFLSRLSSVDPEDRLRAVQVLGVIGGPDAVRGLRGALADPDVRVRARAASFLGALGDSGAVPALRRMFLTDPVGEAAAAAEAALKRLGAVREGEEARPGDVPEDAPGPNRD